LPLDDGSHPEPGSFSERYVLVEPPGGPATWVSLSVRRAPFGKLPFELQGGTALVLDPRGGGRFAPVPAQPLEESSISTLAELTLSAPDLPDLSARARVDLVYRPLGFYGQKEQFRTIKEDRKRQYLSRMGAGLFPGARVAAGDFPGLAGLDDPLAVHLELLAPQAVVPRGKEEVLLRPVLQPLAMIKLFIQRPRREHPYRLGGEMVRRDRTRIATGPRYRLGAVPESVSQVSRIGSYSLVFTPEGPDGNGGEVLRVEREVTVLPVNLGPDEFPRVVEFCQAIDRAEEARLVLTRRPAAAE
jgi:hypothetical protein